MNAEILKLADLLGTEPAALDALTDVSVEDLRAFRSQVTDRVFDANKAALTGIARATSLVPVALSAKVAQASFPPRLAALVAGELEPGRAVDLAKRLSVEYVADLSPALDPRRVTAIISQLPTGLIVQVAALLAERGETLAMGRFVGQLDSDTIRKTLDVIDDEALIRTGFAIEETDRLPEIAAMLSSERLDSIVRVAASRDLLPEALTVLAHLDQPARERLASLPALEDTDLRKRVVGVAEGLGYGEIVAALG